MTSLLNGESFFVQKKCRLLFALLASQLVLTGFAPLLAASESAQPIRSRVLPEACEVALALSAAPAYLRDEAGVYVFTEGGYELHRASKNPFTCIVNRDHPEVLKPTCFDEEGTSTIIPKIRHVGAQLLKGVELPQLREELSRAFDEGVFQSPARPGVAYMLSRYNRPYNSATGELGFFPPHVMFYAPNLTNEDIGHDMAFYDPKQPLPMIAYGGPQGYMIMISDDGTPRSRSDLDQSCPGWVYD